MDSMSSTSMESMAATSMISRRRPLHTCGVSILAIAHQAYTKAQNLKGPVGSITKKMAPLAILISPFIYAMQLQWLAVLSFADDRILAIENLVEKVCPPSTHVFNWIDEVVHITETLPENFDCTINKFPIIIHQVPFLDSVLVHAISWLKFLISLLTHWGANSTREKEITVDTSHGECNNESATSADIAQHSMEPTVHVNSENMEKSLLVSDTPQAETRDEAGVTKCTYKEILEKGKKENLETYQENLETYKEILEKGLKENSEKKEVCAEEEIQKNNVGKEETGEGEGNCANTTKESITTDDPILELFESAWHMKPARGGSGNVLPHSISFT